jgi:hypothetical protein
MRKISIIPLDHQRHQNTTWPSDRSPISALTLWLHLDRGHSSGHSAYGSDPPWYCSYVMAMILYMLRQVPSYTAVVPLLTDMHTHICRDFDNLRTLAKINCMKCSISAFYFVWVVVKKTLMIVKEDEWWLGPGIVLSCIFNLFYCIQHPHTLTINLSNLFPSLSQSSQKTVDELRSALLAREKEVERLKHSYEQARHTKQQLRSQVKIIL